MKKLIIIAALVALIAVICVVIGKGVINNRDKTYIDKAYKSIEKYYQENDAQNTGELKVFLRKSINDNQHLILAEKHRGDGQLFSELFLLDSNCKILATASVEAPISPCFSLGQIFYDGKTILFGSFDDNKYVPKDDKVAAVKINKIFAELNSGETAKESVDMNKGYIIVLDGESEVKTFNLYNEKDELQSSINDVIVSNQELHFLVE